MKYPINERVLVRTRTSGVSIGILKAIDTENGMSIRLKNAVRIWSWSSLDDDFALACSSLATKGAKCKIEHHPKRFHIEAPEGGEVMVVSDEAWEKIKGNWTLQ